MHSEVLQQNLRETNSCAYCSQKRSDHSVTFLGDDVIQRQEEVGRNVQETPSLLQTKDNFQDILQNVLVLQLQGQIPQVSLVWRYIQIYVR